MVYNEFSCCVNARENNHVLVAGDMLDKIHFCDITIIFNLNEQNKQTWIQTLQ